MHEHKKTNPALLSIILFSRFRPRCLLWAILCHCCSSAFKNIQEVELNGDLAYEQLTGSKKSQIQHKRLIIVLSGCNFVAFSAVYLKEMYIFPSVAPPLSPCEDNLSATCGNALNQSEYILSTYATSVKHGWALHNPRKPILHWLVF